MSLLAAALEVLLLGCGERSVGTVPAQSAVTGVQAATVINNDLPVPTCAPSNRFARANGCFGLQSRKSDKYVVTTGVASAASGSSLSGATGFRMKSTTLSRYAIYDAQQRWLDATQSADTDARAGSGAVDNGGQVVSAEGDALWLVPPLVPVGDLRYLPRLSGRHSLAAGRRGDHEIPVPLGLGVFAVWKNVYQKRIPAGRTL